MTSVYEVAKYFLTLGDEEAGDLLSNLKLQKLCYYAQGFHLALFEKPLFNDRIEAWTHGPVVPDLYHAYKQHGSGAIPMPQGFAIDAIDKDVRELLDEVYDVYGQYSAWKLRNMTHDEAPWVQAFARSPGAEISISSMRGFFKALVAQ
jgi:uncharacterized phage-associated protein